MKVQLPAFVFWLCGGSAMLIIALALPLWLRRVPPNALYGARFAATLVAPEIWYRVNARGGRDLALVGSAYLAAICVLAMRPGWRQPTVLLPVTGGFLVLLLVCTFRLSRFADRLAREAVNREITHGLPNER